jgi:hypothetical protein
VAAALKWLAAHQQSDGGWNFELRQCRKCRGPRGQMAQARIAATALALLPFLGSGQTHKRGEYQKQIQSGLYFLTRSLRQEPGGGSLWEQGGRMYAHGLAAIVLSEVHALTRDPQYKQLAQSTLDYIVAAQDPQGGGWRYRPQEAGDTSVVGWQMMALKSGEMAYLSVPVETYRRAAYFLDSVQLEDGAVYGYTGPGDGPATTAIGLLCRMYLGRRPDHAAQRAGILRLAQWGPSLDTSGPPRNNMYYNYYATQVLHHAGGYEWKQWNQTLREYLIARQATLGHDYGSWYLPGNDHGAHAGGRLYFTAMAAMTLEVYYRHLPLYRASANARPVGAARPGPAARSSGRQ